MKSMIILIPIIFPQIISLLIGILKFRDNRKRNYFIFGAILLNLLQTIYIFRIKGLMGFHIFKINNLLDIYFKVDRLGILFVLMVSILWAFTAIYSFIYMTHEKKEKRYYIYFMLTLGITIGIGLSGNLFTLYIFYEFLTLATFPLVIHSGSREALRVGKKYLIYSIGGATLALLGIILIFSLTSSVDFLEKGILNNLDINNDKLLLTIYMIMFIGFGVKAALVPFHSWLPAAMVAPTPVSALLHAVAVVKSGVFVLIRISYYVFGVEVINKIHGNYYISILVLLTILMGSLLGSCQVTVGLKKT